MLKHWPLHRNLKLQPLLHKVFFVETGERDALLGIVSVKDIVHYGCGFGEQEAGVRVFDYGRHAVAIYGKEVGLFQFGSCVDFVCVGDVEFFEEDYDFPGVGTGCGI